METNNKGKNTTMKWLSAIFIILALAYLIMPIDYDGPVIGFVDDFFVFMAAFCFAFAQFSRKANQIIRRQLYIFSISFMVLAILWIILLSYSQLLQIVA